MNNRNTNSRRGFTLVESLISLAIFSVIMYIGYMMLNRTNLSLARQQQSLETLHDARNFLMYIERDMREMIQVKELDTVFTSNLFDERYALFFKLSMIVPNKDGNGTQKVTYRFEGPQNYEDIPGKPKKIYREVENGPKQVLISKQLDYLKIWGTDGTIFRSREEKETETSYVSYLTKHYYNPSNPTSKGLRKLEDVKGLEVQLSMHEMLDKNGKPIKQRKFITRIYPRILNAKYE